MFNVDGLCRLAARSFDRSPAARQGWIQLYVPHHHARRLRTCATASKWSRVFRTRLQSPSTTRLLVKWPLWTYSVPLGSLFLRSTDTRLSRTTRLEPVISSWIRPRHQVKGVWFDLGNFSRAPADSTRVENDLDIFPRWRKPVLCTRPGEGGKGAEHPFRGRAFLRRSRCTTASVVWQEITARRRPGTMYAAFCLF